ncbi:MAG: hypothetical protein LBK82_04230 [Planctomycetaceae bacterium]|jgi:hypothetical protein|nr:hypothetical protein [Planctomycetaceae bacterium]
MRNPTNSIHTEHSFAGEGMDLPDSLLGGADSILDAEAQKSYEKRLQELATERLEAEKDKNLGDPVILLRDRIRRVINTFIDQVSSNDSIGGQYLKNSIRRGVFMKYSPSQEIGWVYP